MYTGLLGYVGAKTGLSMDLLAKRAFGEKGSYLSSAMISFTQIGWFGVGVAMFAIPVSGELLGGSKAAMWALVLVAGGCMTASAYFGIDSLTVVSYIAVPLVAILGTVAMVMAVRQGNGTIVDQFAVSSGSVTVIGGAGYGSRFLRIRRNGNSELCKICKGCQIRYNCNGCSILYREFTDVLFWGDCLYFRWRK